MDSLTQIVNFEITTACNLGALHKLCPNAHPARFASLPHDTPMSDELIVASAVALYREYGFRGLVGWHYYCEPLMDAKRMFRLMLAIRRAAPAAQFLLWSNGTLLDRYKATSAIGLFSVAVITNYGHHAPGLYSSLPWLREQIPVVEVVPAKLDGRLDFAPCGYARPCLRMYLEADFDFFGNLHLCCYDWRGLGSPGNLNTTPLADLIERWIGIREGLGTVPYFGTESSAARVPDSCRWCGARFLGNATGHVPGFVCEIAQSARERVAELGGLEIGNPPAIFAPFKQTDKAAPERNALDGMLPGP